MGKGAQVELIGPVEESWSAMRKFAIGPDECSAAAAALYGYASHGPLATPSYVGQRCLALPAGCYEAYNGAVSVPVTLGEDGRVEHLTYKHGESLEDVVRDFCARHGVVDPGAIQHLEAGLRARVFSQRTT